MSLFENSANAEWLIETGYVDKRPTVLQDAEAEGRRILEAIRVICLWLELGTGDA